MDMNKVKYYTDNKKIVAAVTKWMGHKLRAEARCAPSDTFDFEKGKRIAGLRLKLMAQDMQLSAMGPAIEHMKDIVLRVVDKYNKDLSRYNNLLAQEYEDYNALLIELGEEPLPFAEIAECKVELTPEV